MHLVVPKDSKDPIKLVENAALTVVPAGSDKLFYYHGELADALAAHACGFTSYSEGGVGKIIREKQLAMEHYKPGFRKDLMLVIKPVNSCNCQHIVNLLDEVLINEVSKYAIVEATDDEKQIVEKGKM